MAVHVTAELIALGVPVFSPIVHSHPVAELGGLDPVDPDLWAKVDRPLVDAAGALIVYEAPGWRESSGVVAEIRLFKQARKPIFYIKPTKPLVAPAEAFEWLHSLGGNGP